jgi:zinc protease
VAPEPEQLSSRRKTLRLDLQVEKLMLAYPIPSQNSEDMPALDILQMVLSGGRSSRLQKALVETGIASGAYAYAAGSKDPSIFLFGVTLQKGQKALSAERVILRELERLAREGVPSQELERALNLVEFDYFGGLESNSELARFVGHYESQTGRLENGPLYFEKLKKVTAEQIRQMALKYLKESKRSVVVALKKAQK